MIKTIVVDFGNTIFKVEDIHFLNRQKEINSIGVADKNYLKYESQAFLMELEGSKMPKEYIKANRDFVTPTLYGIAKNFKEENIEINILGCLPIDQFENKEKVVSELSHKEFNIEVCGNKKKIKIKDVYIVKECVASVYTLKDRSGQKLLLDIGSLTTNIFVIRNGKSVIEATIPMGLIAYYKMISDKYISNGYGKIFSEEINMMLDNKKFIEKYKDIIQEAKGEFVNELVNELKALVSNIDMLEIILIGGGALEFNKEIYEIYKDVKLHKNPLFANVDGLRVIRKIKSL